MAMGAKAKQYWCLILGVERTQLVQFQLQPNSTIKTINQQQWRTKRLQKTKGKALRQCLNKHSRVLVLIPSFLCHYFQVSLDRAFSQLEKTQFIQQLVAEKTHWPKNHTLLIEEALTLSQSSSPSHSVWTTNSDIMLQLFPFELLLTTCCKRLECLQMTLAWLVYKFEQGAKDEYWGVVECQQDMGSLLLHHGKQLVYQKSWSLCTELDGTRAASKNTVQSTVSNSESLRKFEQKLLQTFTLLQVPPSTPLYGLDADLNALRSINLAERFNLKSMSGVIPNDEEGVSVRLSQISADSALLTKHLYLGK